MLAKQEYLQRQKDLSAQQARPLPTTGKKSLLDQQENLQFQIDKNQQWTQTLKHVESVYYIFMQNII